MQLCGGGGGGVCGCVVFGGGGMLDDEMSRVVDGESGDGGGGSGSWREGGWGWGGWWGCVSLLSLNSKAQEHNPRRHLSYKLHTISSLSRLRMDSRHSTIYDDIPTVIIAMQ